MTDGKVFQRSLNGTMINMYYDSIKLFKITFIISLSFLLLTHITNIFFLVIPSQSGNSTFSSNGGMMNATGMIAAISIGISAIVSTTKSELNSKFFFPVSRKVYLSANFIMMLFSAFVLTVMCSVFGTIDLFIGRVMNLISGKFMMLSYFSVSSLLYGTVSFYFYLVVLGSAVFCIFLYIKRWTIPTLVILGFFIFTPIFTGVWQSYYNIFEFLFGDSSFLLQILKLSILTILLHAASYVPLRKWEVS